MSSGEPHVLAGPHIHSGPKSSLRGPPNTVWKQHERVLSLCCPSQLEYRLFSATLQTDLLFIKSCLTLCDPMTAALQASLSFTISRGLLKLMSIELVMPSNHLILCHPLLLLPSIFPIIRVFSNELTLHIMGPKYWSFSFSTSPAKDPPFN